MRSSGGTSVRLAGLSVRCPLACGIVSVGDVLRRLRMVALTATGLMAAGCSSPAPAGAPSRSTRATTSPSPTGPCASVRTTTSIDQVPQACAELWAPYQVTKVPPPDILQQEHVPPAPPVVNMTDGAVSDATARQWADASNRDSGWFKWAEASDQPGLLRKLAGPAVITVQDQEALSVGAYIIQPDCNLYPTQASLYVVGSDGKSYFARKSLPTDTSYVFVVRYTGPCAETAVYPDGHSQAIQGLRQPTTVFTPGEFRQDVVLGPLWYTDAGGNCQDSVGPPPEWCGR